MTLDMNSVTVFIDTNCFLQLRDLKDLPWKQLFPETGHVSLQVAPVVIVELDRHKVGNNDRRRNRSRSALKLVEQASAMPDQTLTLRESSPKITLALARRPLWTSDLDLDPGSADDHLVAAAVSHSPDAKLLSHDTGPRISGRRIGLEAFAPPEAWMLPDEPSEDTKKIRRLETELKKLRDRMPELSIVFPDADTGGRVTLLRFRVPKISAEDAGRLATEYASQHPRRVLTINASVHFHSTPNTFTQAEVDSYNRDYEKFTQTVQTYFRDFHKRLERITSAARLPFTITNAGGASAKDLVVQLEANGELLMLADSEDAEEMLGSFDLPAPPQPINERMKLVDRASRSLSMHFPPPASKSNDPTSMRWINRPGSGDHYGTYGCDDFRPRASYDDCIFLWSREAPARGAFTVTASASDTASIVASVEVDIETCDIGWDSDVLQDILPADLLALLQANLGPGPR